MRSLYIRFTTRKLVRPLCLRFTARKLWYSTLSMHLFHYKEIVVFYTLHASVSLQGNCGILHSSCMSFTTRKVRYAHFPWVSLLENCGTLISHGVYYRTLVVHSPRMNPTTRIKWYAHFTCFTTIKLRYAHLLCVSWQEFCGKIIQHEYHCQKTEVMLILREFCCQETVLGLRSHYMSIIARRQ